MNEEPTGPPPPMTGELLGRMLLLSMALMGPIMMKIAQQNTDIGRGLRVTLKEASEYLGGYTLYADKGYSGK